MNIGQMRDFVANAYPGNWKDKVRGMDDDQIIAIYMRIQKDGVEPKPETQKSDETQLRLF